jgi:hypothetical protein
MAEYMKLFLEERSAAMNRIRLTEEKLMKMSLGYKFHLTNAMTVSLENNEAITIFFVLCRYIFLIDKIYFLGGN